MQNPYTSLREFSAEDYEQFPMFRGHIFSDQKNPLISTLDLPAEINIPSIQIFVIAAVDGVSFILKVRTVTPKQFWWHTKFEMTENHVYHKFGFVLGNLMVDPRWIPDRDNCKDSNNQDWIFLGENPFNMV